MTCKTGNYGTFELKEYSDEEKINQIKSALDSYEKGELNEFQTVLVINNIVNRRLPTKEDFEWVEKMLKEIDGNE